MDSNKITLSVCMIVKNEQSFLNYSLDSVKDIADEIIVVDTGSTDQTIGIAKSYGAKVFHFTWCNDFSAARNESIKHATCDWILVLDADEILLNEDKQKVLALIAQADQHNWVGVGITSRHYTNESNNADLHHNNSHHPLLNGFNAYYDDKWKTRIFKNTPHIFYSNKVHEDVNPSIFKWDQNESSKKIMNTDILFHHVNAMRSPQTILEKQKQYFALTKEVIKHNPSTKLYFDLAAGYLFFESDVSTAISLLSAALSITTDKGLEETVSEIFAKIDYETEDVNVIFNILKGFFVAKQYVLLTLAYESIKDRKVKLAQEPQLRALVGVSYAQQNDVQMAINVISELVNENPRNQQYIFNLAALYEKSKQYSQAIRMFERLVALNHPQSNQINTRIELLKKHISQENL